MKLFVYNIVESYTEIIVVHLGNAGAADFLLHIVQCWCTCAVDKDIQSLPIVLYCSGIMY